MEAGTDVTLHLTSLPELHGPVDLTMPAMSTDAHVEATYYAPRRASISLPPTAAPFGDTT